MATYEEICNRVWEMCQRFRSNEPDRNALRHFLMPPPTRGGNVGLLIIGMSPNDNAKIRFGDDRVGAEEFAARFEYVKRGRKPTPGLAYGKYYSPLWKLAKQVAPSFGLWWEVKEEKAEFLIEFTDLLHIATKGGGDDLKSLTDDSNAADPLRQECIEILGMEIELYRPRAILCNGRFPSDALHFMCTGQRMSFEPPFTTSLLWPANNCSVHFMDFYRPQKLDHFCRQRIANEIRQHLFSRA